MSESIEPAAPPPPDHDLGTSSTGLDPKVAAALAYLMGWLTGILFFLLERENRYVRFHAMQSIVGFGAICAAGMALGVLAVLSVFVADGGVGFFATLAQLVWVVGLIAWLICLFKAYSGERWKLPLAGDIAERITAR